MNTSAQLARSFPQAWRWAYAFRCELLLLS